MSTMDEYDDSQLQKVQLNADTYMTCLQHALSTKNFEIMGLLIGNYEDRIVKISASVSMKRLDKKKDRVEISSTQLFEAAAKAEKLTEQLGRRMRVLGWYHSHPNITVFPSHVDLRTQATYQQMDQNFIGLIFSVFTGGNESKGQDMLLTCFQSRNDEQFQVPLEIVYNPEISLHSLQSMTNLPEILLEEEANMAEGCEDNPDFLAQIHNSAVRIQAVSHITDIITRPLIQSFEDRVDLNRKKLPYLKQELVHMKEKLKRLELSKSDPKKY